MICAHCSKPIYEFEGGWAHEDSGETVCRYAVAEPEKEK